ncbi:PAS domain S-box protein [Halovenus salina]|uniref:PAS domain S-box protein n=1 Tax=Halovenus salina TaxID=1510225 RepID=A0ABD5W338_9EURY
MNEEGFSGQRAANIVTNVMESSEPRTFEWKLEAADGSHRVLEVTGTPAEINGEERYISLTRDITERRQREREYEQIFNNVNDAIAVFDPATGDIVDVNEAYREMLGYDDLDTICELGIEGLSASDEGFTGERGWELIRAVSQSGEPETVEWRGETSDGDRLWQRRHLHPQRLAVRIVCCRYSATLPNVVNWNAPTGTSSRTCPTDSSSTTPRPETFSK